VGLLTEKKELSAAFENMKEKLITLPKSTPNVGEMLSHSLASDREQNRCSLLKILSGLRFLACQGCATRGDLGEGN